MVQRRWMFVVLLPFISGCAQCTDVWITSPTACETPEIDISQLPHAWGVEVRQWTENGMSIRHIYKVAVPPVPVRIVLLPSTRPATKAGALTVTRCMD